MSVIIFIIIIIVIIVINIIIIIIIIIIVILLLFYYFFVLCQGYNLHAVFCYGKMKYMHWKSLASEDKSLSGRSIRAGSRPKPPAS